MNIRNVAIIAHVDHGKTTLVDRIIEACKVDSGKDNDGELVLDFHELERERGITIRSKNIAVNYNDHKINIIDTPGHADFGGEVERVLNMADGVLLLVDAFEGPMPQTRFVLSKALQLGLKPIVVVNKVDKLNCRPDEVVDDIFELMDQLGATEDQLNFISVYGSSKQGWMGPDWKTPTSDITYVLDEIIKTIPAPKVPEGNLQFQVTNFEFSTFIGKIAIGRVHRGQLTSNTQVVLSVKDGSQKKVRIKELFVFDGLSKKKVEHVQGGDICALSGIEEFEIGDCLCDVEHPEPLPSITLEDPTINMLFSINNSPFYGKEGKFVTSKHVKARLEKETQKDIALKLNYTEREDQFQVFGRGILHMSILLETMRREGYELQVGKPQVIIKEVNGQKMEPFEQLVIDVLEEYSGKVIQIVTQRKGQMMSMESRGDRQILLFEIPTRGLIGIRNILLTASAGEAVVHHQFLEYRPIVDGLPDRDSGSLISMETGMVTAYSVDRLQDRGIFLVDPGEEVYKGQVIGIHTRGNDLELNVQKGKKLTNMRAAGSDDNAKIAPKKVMSLEETLAFIKNDEWVEITPKAIRVRKRDDV